jgi:hypothetical protein
MFNEVAITSLIICGSFVNQSCFREKSIHDIFISFAVAAGSYSLWKQMKTTQT